MNLERKQEYFEYRGGWYYKQPPRLDHAIHRRLHEIDPSLHFIWGGVAIIRNSPDGDPVSVLGDTRATQKFRGRLMARWLNKPVKTFRGYSFPLKDGRERIVMREDSIPVDKQQIAVARFEYTDFGNLRWYLTRLLTPDQAVAAGIFAPDDPDIPAEGYYYCHLPVETPDGRYWEPDRVWLESVAARVYETFNTPLADLYLRDHEVREQRIVEQEEATEQQTAIPPEEILKMSIEPERHL